VDIGANERFCCYTIVSFAVETEPREKDSRGSGGAVCKNCDKQIDYTALWPVYY